jgi:hypothetical protein
LLSLPGVTITQFELDIGFSRFDLALDLQLHGDSFTGYLEYNGALFDQTTVRRLAARLRALLADALARPELPVSELIFDAPTPATIRGSRWKR